jgi:hypothetical protein
MPDTITEFYDFVKPEIDASADTWGEKLNANLDKLDTALRNCLVVSSPPEFTTPLVAQGSTIPLYLPTQADGAVVTHAQLASTQGWVDLRIRQLLNQFIPINTIMLWWGDFGSVPAGWTFCDGTLGSPDLRDRFVLCAGNFQAPKTAGGTPSAYPGEHTHANTYNTYPGVVSTTVLEVHNSQAIYPGDASTLPYFALMYIRKYAAW